MFQNAPNNCTGIIAFPPISNFARGFDIFLIIAYCVLGIFTLILMVRFKENPSVKVRSVLIGFINVFTYSLFTACLVVWHLDLPQFPCLANAIIWLIAISLHASGSCAKLINLLFKARYQLNTRNVQNVFDRQEISSQSSFSSRGELITEHTFSFTIVETLISIFQHDYAAAVGDSEGRPEKLTQALLQQRHAVKPLSVMKLILILCFPSIIAILALVLSHGVYYDNCVGCDLYLELVIAIVVIYVCLLILRLRITRVIMDEKVEDTFGFVLELKVNAICFGGLWLISVILFALDPGNLQQNNQVNWLWFVQVGIMFVLFWEYTRHCIYAWKESRVANENQNNPKTKGPDISKVLDHQIIFNRFEKFAEKNFVGESAKFLRDCKRYETWVEGRSHELIRQKAKAMVALYISQNAGLQVNLSAKSRLKIEQRVQKGDIGSDLFKEAQKDILNMIQHSIWNKFVASGGLEGYVSPEDEAKATALEGFVAVDLEQQQGLLVRIGSGRGTKTNKLKGNSSSRAMTVKVESSVSA